jgi:hypothetical protein
VVNVRTRVVVLAVVATVLVGGALAFVLASRPTPTPSPTRTSLPTVAATLMANQPRVIFRNTVVGPELGRVAMSALGDPAGPRALTDLICDRVFAAGGRTLCLSSDPGVVTTYSATVYDDATGARTVLPLTGSPSRARLSPDGGLAATTSFVAGDSYAATSFSTRTVITDLLPSGKSHDLESFTLVDDGRTISPVDRNYWGVSFAADDDRFYVTVAFGGQTHLAEGRVSTRAIRTLRTDAECPSLSPDQTRVAYKKRGNRERGDWRIGVLDLATGREKELTEYRSVDDQVEWLDDEHIIYGLPGEGSAAAETNVWVVPADGSGEPTLLIPNAWSPAVIR